MSYQGCDVIAVEPNDALRQLGKHNTGASVTWLNDCSPFAYWPNNDKWNLLPTTAKENLSKRDKLPTAKRLYDSKRRIINWWQLAWGSNQQRFFTEASLSLPNLPAQCGDFEAIFEAMGLQVKGVKSRLLVS